MDNIICESNPPCFVADSPAKWRRKLLPAQHSQGPRAVQTVWARPKLADVKKKSRDFASSQQATGIYCYVAVCQNLVPLVNIKIAGKWMFIPLKMVLIGIDP